MTICVSYVDPHFPNMRDFEENDYISMYIKVFDSIWGYMKVYKDI